MYLFSFRIKSFPNHQTVRKSYPDQNFCWKPCIEAALDCTDNNGGICKHKNSLFEDAESKPANYLRWEYQSLAWTILKNSDPICFNGITILQVQNRNAAYNGHLRSKEEKIRWNLSIMWLCNWWKIFQQCEHHFPFRVSIKVIEYTIICIRIFSVRCIYFPLLIYICIFGLKYTFEFFFF